jgi:hypothetical protein
LLLLSFPIFFPLNFFILHTFFLSVFSNFFCRSFFFSILDASSNSRLPFFEANLFVERKPNESKPTSKPTRSKLSHSDEVPLTPFGDEPLMEDSLESPRIEPALILPSSTPGKRPVRSIRNENNSKTNDSTKKKPSTSHFIICFDSYEKSATATDAENNSGVIVTLLAPQQYYEKCENTPARLAQKEIEKKFRDEFNRSIDQDEAYAGIPSFHRPYVKDKTNPATEIRM